MQSRYKKAADFLHDYLVNDYSRIQSGDAKGCFSIKIFIPIRCGWMDFTWGLLFMLNGKLILNRTMSRLGQISLTSLKQLLAIHMIRTNSFIIMPGQQIRKIAILFWANKTEPYKGCSKEFWGRGMGWYFAALVDVLEVMPKTHADYKELVTITNTVAKGLKRWQDKTSGVWYQLLQYDNSYVGECGIANYLESSASSMFTYAYLKGVRLGILPKSYEKVAEKAYQGLLKTFVTSNNDGTINLNQSCRSAGLGPAKDPSRDGSASYYLCGKDVTIVSNEGKAIGPFIMASLEYELKK